MPGSLMLFLAGLMQLPRLELVSLDYVCAEAREGDFLCRAIWHGDGCIGALTKRCDSWQCFAATGLLQWGCVSSSHCSSCGSCLQGAISHFCIDEV